MTEEQRTNLANLTSAIENGDTVMANDYANRLIASITSKEELTITINRDAVALEVSTLKNSNAFQQALSIREEG